jgi:chorismate mutase
MDIDRKLLSRCAALLSEARDAVERVRFKASDILNVIDNDGPTDEDFMEVLVKITNDIDAIIATVDKLAKED